MVRGYLVLGRVGIGRRGVMGGYVDVKESVERSMKGVYRPEG